MNSAFWTHDISQLINSFDLIPKHDDDFNTQLNTIMRLTIIACFAIAAFKPILAFSTLLIVVAFSMTIYAFKTQPILEGFQEGSELQTFMNEYERSVKPPLRFCNDQAPIDDDWTLNASLHGGPNPKTKCHPFVAAPSHDLDEWKANDFVIHSNINSQTNFDFGRSGALDNLLTQTLQPGVFQKSNILEPIQSNIGISFTPQFPPTIVEGNQSRQLAQHALCKRELDNVYDPRFSGYADESRAFVDGMGRPSFAYTDVDAVKMPNYLTRSNIDVFPWASTCGSEMAANRELANNAFTDSTILFRTEMQERLMRKRNAESWQRRAFPISTMNKTSYLAR